LPLLSLDELRALPHWGDDPIRDKSDAPEPGDAAEGETITEGYVCVCGAEFDTRHLERECARLRSALTTATREREERDEKIAELVAVAHKHGWNGVENSKILACFFDNALSDAESALSGAAERERDTKRLDWLDAEHDRVDPIAALVLKRHHDRASSEWANLAGSPCSVRAAIDAAMSALSTPATDPTGEPHA
jgi:hypothetical protein